MALEPMDGVKLAHAIAETADSLEEAASLGAGAGNRDPSRWSYSDQAAYVTFNRYAPESVRRDMSQKFHELSPGLKPAGTSDDGTNYYLIEDVARELGGDVN